MSDKYLGYSELHLTDAEYNELYSTHKLSGYFFAENEYIYIPPLIKGTAETILQYRCGELYPIQFPVIDNIWMGQIKPRNPQQAMAMSLLLNNDIPVKILKGVYGSGKDMLMLGAALDLVQQRKYKKIVYIRPNITVKGLPDIGAIPGDTTEKLMWTLGPVIDKIGGEAGIEELMRQELIEVIPLLFIRGRSFDDSIVYVSEGQNMTTEIAKLILGRIGENSALWINGDTHQTDKKIFDEDNGIDNMINCFMNEPLVGYVYLPKTERSAVANLANQLDEYTN